MLSFLRAELLDAVLELVLLLDELLLRVV